MSRSYQQTQFRPPPELRKLLVDFASINRRSLNSEIIFGLEFYARHVEQAKKASDQPASNPDASTTTA